MDLRLNKLRLCSDAFWVALAVTGCTVNNGSGSDPTTGAAGTAGSTGGVSSTTGGPMGTGGAPGAGGSPVADAANGGGGSSNAGAAGSGGDVGTGGSLGGGLDAGDPCVVGTGPPQLPFAVDKYFVASGWMQPALIHQDTTCAYPPVPAPASDGGAASDAAVDAAPASDGGAARSDAAPPFPDTKCWTVTYTPMLASDWAGVDWQFPVNNWGTGDGLVIPPGATKVSLVAWGDVGNEKVSFNVGYGAGSTDRFGATSGDRFLTTDPTPISIDMTGIAYTCHGVRMGFGWIAAGGTAITFHFANVRWE